jgi:hypothetical protein
MRLGLDEENAVEATDYQVIDVATRAFNVAEHIPIRSKAREYPFDLLLAFRTSNRVLLALELTFNLALDIVTQHPHHDKHHENRATADPQCRAIPNSNAQDAANGETQHSEGDRCGASPSGNLSSGSAGASVSVRHRVVP